MPVVVEWRRPGLPTTDDAEKEEAWELVGPRRASTCQATAFRLLRQDDNGASAEVARYGSRCEALAAAEAFEARHHKQTYWVEEG
ncbi:MAG: hypothetical protein JNL79_27580 [Myxococcales bacterium]|nr:hypothetical protein [Myxococcales bacterium]